MPIIKSKVQRENKMSITIQNMSKNFGEEEVLKDINLIIKPSEFVSVIGPNGCGKTTILKTIAGITEYQGEITKSSDKISYVSQNPDEMILPWLNVIKNITYPKNRVQENTLNISGLAKYKKHYPNELSGGMKQMLLIARALSSNSEILLLDEPFKSLDVKVARETSSNIKEIWRKFKPTIVMVTHDIEKALCLSTKIVLLSEKPTRIRKVYCIKEHVKEYEKRKIMEEILDAFL